MNFPSMDDTSEFGTSSVPSEGQHDVTLKNMEYKKSSNDNDMLVATLVIDNGEDCRMHLTEYMVMGHDSGIGESRLFSIAKNSRNHEHPNGFEWSEDVSSWDEFAAQFVLENPLRFRVEVEHEYSIETERGWKNDVTQEKYEEHINDGGKGRPDASVVGYYEPANRSEIPNLKPNSTEQPSEENGFPEYEGDGAPSGDSASDDGDGDGLPF